MTRPDDARQFADCPWCGDATYTWRNYLTDEEYADIISCGSCDFGIETTSNKAHQTRRGQRGGGA